MVQRACAWFLLHSLIDIHRFVLHSVSDNKVSPLFKEFTPVPPLNNAFFHSNLLWIPGPRNELSQVFILDAGIRWSRFCESYSWPPPQLNIYPFGTRFGGTWDWSEPKLEEDPSICRYSDFTHWSPTFISTRPFQTSLIFILFGASCRVHTDTIFLLLISTWSIKAESAPFRFLWISIWGKPLGSFLQNTKMHTRDHQNLLSFA